MSKTDSKTYNCRYSSCSERFDSRRGRSIHESHVHGSVKTDDWDDESYLRKKYIKEGLSINEIADENDAPYNRVRDRIKAYGIETRGTNETRYFDRRKKLENAKHEIIRKYREEEIPLYKLANEYSVDDATLKRHLVSWGIETRGLSEQISLSFENQWQTVTDREKMKELYVEKRLSMREISRRTGRSLSVISRKLREYGFEIRDKVESTRIARSDIVLRTEEYNGYTFVHNSGETVRMHRLLATLKVDKISDLEGKHVHHINEIEWCNYEDNLEVVDVTEHLNHHNPNADYSLEGEI